MWRHDDGDVVKTALVESFELAQNGVRKCWATHLVVASVHMAWKSVLWAMCVGVRVP